MPKPSCHPSWKAKKPWREIKARPIQAGKWFCSHLQMNESMPEWWGIRSLLCTKGEHFGNIKVKGLACQQTAAFRVPAAQQEKDGWWPALPCLSVLEWGDYLPPKEFKGTPDYWEVQCKEMRAPTMALQRCAFHSVMPPGMLCRAVQELHSCLTPYLNMEIY